MEPEDDDSIPAANKECDRVLLGAAKGLIKLCQYPSYEKALISVSPGPDGRVPTKSYQPFLQLALVAHDSNYFVRSNFVQYVFNKLKRQRLPFHYIIILALCASHEEKTVSKMKVAIW